jgi:hypothetical protein
MTCKEKNGEKCKRQRNEVLRPSPGDLSRKDYNLALVLLIVIRTELSGILLLA